MAMGSDGGHDDDSYPSNENAQSLRRNDDASPLPPLFLFDATLESKMTTAAAATATKKG